jgi:hypothetical protein
MLYKSEKWEIWLKEKHRLEIWEEYGKFEGWRHYDYPYCFPHAQWPIGWMPSEKSFLNDESATRHYRITKTLMIDDRDHVNCGGEMIPLIALPHNIHKKVVLFWKIRRLFT